jgi:CHAD domain-containing protein
VAVETVLRQRLEHLMAALPGARKGDVDAVHRSRVATRRVRAVLPLVDSRVGRKLSRTIRHLTRTLGPVRELDVTLGVVDTLEAQRELPRSAATALRQAILEERRRLHAALVDEIDHAGLQKLKKRIAAVMQAHARDREATNTPLRIADAVVRVGRRAERLRAAIDSAAGLYLPDRLHEVRIAVKKLRYSMEVLRELRRSRATARIAALKRVQDLLGRMHDLEVLIARTRAVQGSPHAPNLRVSAELDRLVRRLETECRQLHGHYVATRPTLLAICEYAIQQRDERRSPAA